MTQEIAELLFRGLMLCVQLVLACLVVSKAGRSPYWALASVVPVLAVVCIWAFAFTAWPKRDKA